MVGGVLTAGMAGEGEGLRLGLRLRAPSIGYLYYRSLVLDAVVRHARLTPHAIGNGLELADIEVTESTPPDRA